MASSGLSTPATPTSIQPKGSDPSFIRDDARSGVAQQPSSFKAAVAGSRTPPNSRAPALNQIADFLSGIRDKSDTEVFSSSRSGDCIKIPIDESYLSQRVSLCSSLLIFRLLLDRGQKPLSTAALAQKLGVLLKVSDFHIIPIGRGFFNLLIPDAACRRRISEKRVYEFDGGKIRVQRWSPLFNPYQQKNSIATVWVRIFELPFELWSEKIILSIASALGSPVKIDERALNGSLGHFARVLVDVDMRNALPDSITLELSSSSVEISLGFENVPDFCSFCLSLGHLQAECKKRDIVRIPVDPRPKQPNTCWNSVSTAEAASGQGLESADAAQIEGLKSVRSEVHMPLNRTTASTNQDSLQAETKQASDAAHTSDQPMDIQQADDPQVWCAAVDSRERHYQQYSPKSPSIFLSNRFGMLDDDGTEAVPPLSTSPHVELNVQHVGTDLVDQVDSPLLEQDIPSPAGHPSPAISMGKEIAELSEALSVSDPHTLKTFSSREAILQDMIVKQPSYVHDNYEFVEPTTDYNNLVTSHEEFPTLESIKIKQKRGRNKQNLQQTMKPNTRLQTRGIEPFDQMQLIAAMELKRQKNEIG